MNAADKIVKAVAHILQPITRVMSTTCTLDFFFKLTFESHTILFKIQFSIALLFNNYPAKSRGISPDT